MSRKRNPNLPRVGVQVEASTPHLYRWFVAQAVPYVAVRDAGGFTVLDEERWSALLGAAEAREI